MRIEKQTVILSFFFLFLCVASITTVSSIGTEFSITGTPAISSLRMDDRSVEMNTEYVEIPIFLSGNTINVSGIVFSIEFDSNILNLTNIEKGDITQTWDEYHKVYNNSVRVVLTANNDSYLPVNSYGEVICLKFNILSSVNTKIKITNVSVSDENGNVNFSVDIRNMNLTFVLLPTPTPTPTPIPYRGGSGSGGGSNRNIDSDGDGYTNADERLAGTNPYDANDYPKKDTTPEPTPTSIVTPPVTDVVLSTPIPQILSTATPITDIPTKPETPGRNIWLFIILAVIIVFGISAAIFLKHEEYW